VRRPAVSIVVALVALAAACAAEDPPADPPPAKPAKPATAESRKAEVYGDTRWDEDGYRRLDAPKAGEWLARFPEAGETFADWQAERPWVKRPGKETIVLQPLGRLGQEAQAALEAVRAHCAIFFGLATKVADPIPYPDGSFKQQRGQHDAAQLLDHLAAKRPKDALIYAGVCDEDLFVEGLNFVFGLGRGEGLGVYSLIRFGGAKVDPALYRLRSFKLLAHEIGHGFGLAHCIFYGCVMQGANSLAETDGHPVEPCPVCLRKLQAACGLDVKRRWGALADFFDQHGLPDDARWVRARLERLGATKAAAPWKE
jgi:archaemetzincin